MRESLSWPLVGREEELERIARARTDCDCRGIVLAASAGVGKSRLARHAVALAEDDGAFVLWVQATRSAATVPLGACAELLAPDVRADDLLELLRRSAEALRERAEDRPILLGVDDAQLLDPTSAALVLHLTVTGTAFVVATLRTGEPCPDAVESLWKDAGALRLELSPLSDSATAMLVEAALGGIVEQGVGRWVYDSSRGNVLYACELVLGALADGALHDTGGIWHLARRPPPSRPLIELITTRLAGLSEAERRALEFLALGEPLRLVELVELAGADAIEAVEGRGVAVVDGAGAAAPVRLAHPLYGEVIAASMAKIRASQVRRRLAETVQARADRSTDDALRIARWLLDAGEELPLDLLVEAAGAATLAGDPELGARLGRLALEKGGGVDAAVLLARALSVRMRHDEAEAVLAEVERAIVDRAAADRAVAVAYLQQRTLGQVWGLRRPEDAVELLDRARAWWPEPSWRRKIDALRLHPVSITSGFSGAVGVSGDMLDDPDLDAVARRRVELVHATNLLYSGRVREARELIRRHRPTVPLSDELDEIALVLWSVCGQEAGWDFHETMTTMTQALQDAVRANDHTAAGIAASAVGGLYLIAGRYRDAGRWLTESLVHLEQHDPFQVRKAVLGSLTGVAYFTGDPEGAAAAIQRCHDAVGDTPLLDFERSYVVRAEAWAALAAGDPPTAQRLLLECAAELDGVPLLAGHLYHEALRARAPAGRFAAQVAALRDRCDARMMTAYADHVDAAVAKDGNKLLRCAEEFVDIGTVRYGSECAAEAAEAFAAQGRTDSARRAAARSRELHDASQGGFAPEIRGVDSATTVLTPREAQLVDLAARGLSNAEIADRLVLSVRTVESHVYRAMQKLGVSDRRDLPARL